MSTMSFSLVFATLFAFILLANGSPIDSIDEDDITGCPEGVANYRKKNFEGWQNSL